MFVVRLLTALCMLFSVLCVSSGAWAGATVERVKTRGMVNCAGVQRPGLAVFGADGHPAGLEVDVCRAVATALLGSPERIHFNFLDSAQDFAALRGSEIDLAFLSATEIVTHDLAATLLPGPAVFLQSDAVLVSGQSDIQHVDALTQRSICFLMGSSAERSLEDYFARRHLTWLHHPYSEEGEMRDGFTVQQCKGMAAELTDLAAVRASAGVAAPRLLPENLTVFPILAMTSNGSPTQGMDGQWATLVTWTLHTLVAAARPDTEWYAGGWHALPLDLTALGLSADWQKRVVAATGSYADLFERNLGRGSALKLAPGLNRNLVEGGALVAPFIE